MLKAAFAKLPAPGLTHALVDVDMTNSHEQE